MLYVQSALQPISALLLLEQPCMAVKMALLASICRLSCTDIPCLQNKDDAHALHPSSCPQLPAIVNCTYNCLAYADMMLRR